MGDVSLYNVNDGLTGRDGGPYLDEEMDRNAETVRARIEGREPDYDNPGSTAGTVLVTAGTLLANNGVNNLPSTDNSAEAKDSAVKAIADSKDNNLNVRATVSAEDYASVDPDNLPDPSTSTNPSLVSKDADDDSDGLGSDAPRPPKSDKPKPTAPKTKTLKADKAPKTHPAHSAHTNPSTAKKAAPKSVEAPVSVTVPKV